MKDLFKFLFLLVALSVNCLEVDAIRAYPHPITLTQPDGTTLLVRLCGDENFHYITTTDGFMLAKDDAGFFCYVGYDFTTGKKTVSAQRAHNAVDRTAEEKTFMRGLTPAKLINADIISRRPLQLKGPGKTIARSVVAPDKARAKAQADAADDDNESQYLVILVNFTDSVFYHTAEDFDSWLNEPGYSVSGGTGSVKDYYRDNSMGMFVPNYHVVGPYTLSQPSAYYGQNDDSDEDTNPREMVSEACALAKADNPDLDFSQFDNDGDGYMDNCYIIYAGYSEASTANDDDIWPHTWTMGDYAFDIDGITIYSYSCSAELVGTPTTYATPTMDGIGTFTHEFGHILGLKDMYDTDSYTDGNGVDPGDYSLFASGSYNNDSRTPPYLMAFERHQLGWIVEGEDLLELKSAEDVELLGLSENKARYINAQPDRDEQDGWEWFVLENRQQTGWDKYIPAHGLLIYHYDFTVEMQDEYWTQNGPNNNAQHRCLYIKAADGTDDTISRDGDTFPGITANTSFTDTTTPNSINWDHEPTNVPVTNITEKDGLIYFQVCGGTSVWDVIKTNVPSDIRDDSATFTATIESNTEDVTEVGFCWALGEDPTYDGNREVAESVDSPSCSVSGLEAGSLYNVKAYMKLSDGTIVYGSPVPFTTECATASAPYIGDFSSWTNNRPDCWTIVDANGDGTTWVYDESSDAVVYDFDYWNDADDWLICNRRFVVPEHGVLFFTRGITETTGVENLEIYVSTKSTAIDDFVLLDRFSFADYFDQSHIEEADLSEYAGQEVYIAMRCTSEKLQNYLWIFNVLVMDKLGTPEITTFDMLEDDVLTVEWTPVDDAYYYYLYFGKETDEDNFCALFTPLDFYEEVVGDVSLGVGNLYFKSDGYVQLTEIPDGILDCKFIVTASGPSGTSVLTVEGTKDGENWSVVGPRITLDEFDNEGQECDWETYVSGKGYIKLRFKFQHGGLNGRVKYLTLEYNDGKVLEDLAAGYVNGTSMTMTARTDGEFDEGRYAVWVAAGDGLLFYDESETKWWSKEATSVEDVIYGTDITMTVSDGKIVINGLKEGSRVDCTLVSGISVYSGEARDGSLTISTHGAKGIAVIRVTEGTQTHSTKVILK